MLISDGWGRFRLSMENTPPPLLVAPPPPVITPSPERRSGRAWIWVLVTVLVLGLVAMGILIKGASFVMSLAEPPEFQHHGGARLFEVSVDHESSSDKIAIIKVDGIIAGQSSEMYGPNMVDSIKDQFELAEKDSNVKAVILKVNSPGGEVMASDDIARIIREFQQKSKKPVIASMGSLAASGGYYVSAPCRWIIANELTITGSIGVIMQTMNYRGLMDKVGIQPMVFKSGRHKDMLSSSKDPEDIDPVERQIVMDMIMETYQRFTQVVSDGRSAAAAINQTDGRPLANNWKDFADGRILTGSKAFDLGLVDELGNFETAVLTAEKLAKIDGKAHLIRYKETFDFTTFLDLLGGVRSSSPALKVDLGFDIPKLRTGMPYFMLSTAITKH